MSNLIINSFLVGFGFNILLLSALYITPGIKKKGTNCLTLPSFTRKRSECKNESEDFELATAGLITLYAAKINLN